MKGDPLSKGDIEPKVDASTMAKVGANETLKHELVAESDEVPKKAGQAETVSEPLGIDIGDLVEPENRVTEPKNGGEESTRESGEGFTVANLISFAALTLSLTTFGWQTYDAWRGAEIEMMNPVGRSIEFRCPYSADACWKSDKGLLNVIAPAFFTNAGANRYNGVIERVTMTAVFGGESLELVANDIWRKTQSGKNDSEPFIPLVIAGTSAGGSELKFVPYGDKNRKSWQLFAKQIINRDFDDIHITISASLALEERLVSESCTVVVTDRLRVLLERRQTVGKHRYITIGCTEYSGP